VNCYLCGSGDLTVLTRKLRYGDGTVCFCERCGLGMLEHTPEDLRRYYAEEYRDKHGPRVGEKAEYDEIFASYVEYQEPRLRHLRPLLTPESRVLEVGCSAGQLMANTKPLAGEVVGVDYDPAAAAYAAERVGVATYGGELRDTPLEPGSFDVVCAIQVMEHVADPIAFVEELSRYLRPGGTLFLEVPNLLDPLRSVYDEPSYREFYFHRAHIWYFTDRALGLVAQRAGVEGTVHASQDYNVLNHLHWVSAHGPQPDPHAGLGPARLPVREGIDEGLRRDLEAWADEADAAYKAILRRHGQTDNLAFVGTVG
jgi:SAM-dependent methyltransferase